MKTTEKNLTRPQYYRVRRIVALIREGMRRGSLANCASMEADLGVCRRTLLRDLEFLRDDENAPIEYLPSKHGFVISDETWELTPVELSRGEVFAFSIAQRMLRLFRDTPLELDMSSVMRKIGESMEGSVTLDPAVLTDRLTILGEDYVRLDPTIWGEVATAVERREEVRMVYRKFDGETKRYVIEPYHMVAYHGNWYVLAGGGEKAEGGTNQVHR